MQDILYAVPPDIPIMPSDIARTINCGKVIVNIQGPQYQFVRQESKVKDVPTPLNAGKRRACTELLACDPEDGDADMVLETQGKGTGRF